MPKQGKTRKISDPERWRVIHLFQENYPKKVIARKMGISAKAVREIIKKWDATGQVADLKRSGRPKKIGKRTVRLLRRLILANRQASAAELTSFLKKHLNTAISVKTIRRNLKKIGYMGRIAQRKPYISAVNRVKRLKFARRHRRRIVQQWGHVIFSDESSFRMFGHRGQTHVCRLRGEKFHPDCVLPTIKHGGGSIMVWGWMSRSGPGAIYRVEGNMNKHQYLHVLENVMLPSVRAKFSENFIYQQDNAPCHAANDVKTFFDHEEVSVLEWPPQSPDLSPIEHLWGYVDKCLNKTHPTNQQELWDAIRNAWESIPEELCKKLVDSVPRRLSSVIQAKGGPTKY